MYITAATLDDLLRDVLERLIKSRKTITPSRGVATEFTGVLLRLRDPRARLSRTERKGTMFSCLGELLWYLAKSDSLRFIEYYIPRYAEESDDGRTLYGAYGPRLFRFRHNDQNSNVVSLLRHKPDSRRAVVQLFNAEDLAKEHKEIPCTCSFQFMIRGGRLVMLTYMRSNDAFLGLPHDVFAFTMLQEIIAMKLGIPLGSYKHFVGSLHLYSKDAELAQQYLDEGWQPTLAVAMPSMPRGDPQRAIVQLLKAEKAIRAGHEGGQFVRGLDSYWADLVRLLQIFRYSKDKEAEKIRSVRRQMASRIYDPYIAKRQTAVISALRSGQLILPYPSTRLGGDRESE
jgi:thymidylate synthase